MRIASNPDDNKPDAEKTQLGSIASKGYGHEIIEARIAVDPDRTLCRRGHSVRRENTGTLIFIGMWAL